MVLSQEKAEKSEMSLRKHLGLAVLPVLLSLPDLLMGINLV